MDKMTVVLEDTWGDEARILDTARLSASDTKADPDNLTLKDKKLLRDLLYQNHGVPFETLCVRLRLEFPIAVARQLVKHRISSWSELSKRYRGGVGEFYVPAGAALLVEIPDEYKPANWVGPLYYEIATKKEVEAYKKKMEELGKFRENWLNTMYDRIEKARNAGRLPPDPKNGRCRYRSRARETARWAEPVSEYTTVIWTINARSLMNVFFLRMDEHAQLETRWVADQIWDRFSKCFPLLSRFMQRYREALWKLHQELLGEEEDDLHT